MNYFCVNLHRIEFNYYICRGQTRKKRPKIRKTLKINKL